MVCCGGDGTLNETLSGLLSAESKTPIGYIPTGSTNDFASSLKLPLDVLEATKNIIEGQPVPYDAGRFGGRVFSYVASFGAFTRTSYTTPQSIKNALGHTAYVLEGIQELTQIRNEHIKMIVDGEVVEDDFLFGAICNSTSVGGVLTLDPDVVDLQDNKLENPSGPGSPESGGAPRVHPGPSGPNLQLRHADLPVRYPYPDFRGSGYALDAGR